MLSRFTKSAVQTLPEATPAELARLLHGCMTVSCPDPDFFNACVLHNRQHVVNMPPAELVNAAYAYGQCFVVAEIFHLRFLRKIFRQIRLASVARLPLFQPPEIMSLLRTYARWQIAFERDHIRKAADQIYTSRNNFDPDTSIAVLYSMSILTRRTSASGSEGNEMDAQMVSIQRAASALLEPVWRTAAAGNLDVQSLLRAVEAAVTLKS